MLRQMIVIVLAGALSLWLLFEIIRALRTGTANAAGTIIPRRKRALAFWLVPAVQAAFATCITFVLASVLRNALP